MIINKTNLAKYSPLPSNYDFSEIINYVPVAEEIWIRPLIGDEFFDQIQEQVKENRVSSENGTLLIEGKLWQYLSYATVLEGLPFIWANISAAGITLGKSDNSESVNLKDMTYIENHLRRQTEFLKDSVKKYICTHQESFPLADLESCGCGCKCATSCCNDDIEGRLRNPNKYKQLYRPNRIKTDLK